SNVGSSASIVRIERHATSYMDISMSNTGTALFDAVEGFSFLDNVSFSGDVTALQGINLASADRISFTSRSRIWSPADSALRLTNAAGNDFNMLQLGGSSSAFP